MSWCLVGSEMCIRDRSWALSVPYMGNLHARYGQGLDRATWLDMMLAELQRSGALHDDGAHLHDVSN
jgi:hypothetical protein